jgi:hypothetical protein
LRERDASNTNVKLSTATATLTADFQELQTSATIVTTGDSLDVYVFQDNAVTGDSFYADAFVMLPTNGGGPPSSDGGTAPSSDGGTTTTDSGTTPSKDGGSTGPGAGPSGIPMPTASTKAGWTYSYGQDFLTNAALGQFSKVYGSGWAGYDGVDDSTAKTGSYQPDTVLSVANGELDMYIHYDSSTGYYDVCAPLPQPPSNVNGGSAEYLGMRTTAVFKSTGQIPGYKTAWLYWPTSEVWNDGEIDFPEGELDGTIGGFSHAADVNSPQTNTLAVSSQSTYWSGWHTAVTEWIPGTSVEFFLDGVSLGKTTTNVASKSMHWVLQTETDLSGALPAQSASGHVDIDWVTVEAYSG